MRVKTIGKMWMPAIATCILLVLAVYGTFGVQAYNAALPVNSQVSQNTVDVIEPGNVLTCEIKEFRKHFEVSGLGDSNLSHGKLTSGDWQVYVDYKVAATEAGLAGATPTALALTLVNPGGGVGELEYEGYDSLTLPTWIQWKYRVMDEATLILESSYTAAEEILAPVLDSSLCNKLNTAEQPPVSVVIHKLEDTVADGTVSDADPRLEGWTITASNGNLADNQVAVTDGSGEVTFNLDPLVLWTFTETIKSGWAETYPDAGTHSRPVGGLNHFDFGNAHPAAKIDLSPPEDINEVSESHTVTATVMEKVASGVSYVAASGETVVFSIASGTAVFVGGDNDCVTDGAGQCSVQITSSTPGEVVIHASSAVNVSDPDYVSPASVVINVTTEPIGTDLNDNGNDVRKVYVDARIQLTPQDDDNVLNDPHVLTATVQMNTGSGWVNAPDGTTVTFSIVSGSATFVGGDNDCTTVSGQCSVTIVSSVSGTNIIHATTTFNIVVGSLTESVTRSTAADPTGVNLDPGTDARKDYGPPEGCTPGYWKNLNQHGDEWTAPYDPTDLYRDAFGLTAAQMTARGLDADLTLIDALGLGGGGFNKLARHSVAALLNAAHPDVDTDPAFDTTAEVISAVQAAFASGNAEPLASQLDASNNAGCPLS